ncbi:AAA family ATPase [Streptomyces ovatisporus]|uniref:AAA family ATPase n=1 Tax=Streptomyces ovatisporus TaxID=1128682 RepID=A0ABV9AFS2_9ACTN
MLRIAFANLKPGVGKTTSAVWLAYALHHRGKKVVVADSDPGASVLAWSDLAGGFPFRVVGLPVKDMHKRVDDFAEGADAVICDVPQIEDHAPIARSAMRWADELVSPVAPAGIELERMGPILDEVEALESVRADDARACVLLTRTVAGASSTGSARRTLARLGHDVLTATIPRREVFAQSFGSHPPAPGSAYDELATELLRRAA